LDFVTITSADAQTRDGGPVEARKVASEKEFNEARARQRARDHAEERRYKGTQVRLDTKGTGDALALQTRIAGLLSAEDLVPELRKEHFREMSANKHTPITGWYCTILDVTPDRGGAVVTVRVWPRSIGGFATSSTTTERYRFADGRLRFLDLVYKGGISTWQ
jgi:hypothetical protein